jgi:hypothetical protein
VLKLSVFFIEQKKGGGDIDGSSSSSSSSSSSIQKQTYLVIKVLVQGLPLFFSFVFTRNHAND